MRYVMKYVKLVLRYFFLRLLSLIFILFVYSNHVECQLEECDTTIAPEIWSQPEILPKRVNNSFRNNYPFITSDGKTLYYNNKYVLSMTTLADTGWLEPVPLSSRVNSELAQSPSVSPDGKTLYFIDWTGNRWCVFSSTWNDTLNDWNTPEYVEGINSDRSTIHTGHISRDGKKFYFSCRDPEDSGAFSFFDDIYVSVWNDTTKKWGTKKNMGRAINFYNGCKGTMALEEGASLTADEKKIYFCKFEAHPNNFELYVAYKDSFGNWLKAQRLNINTIADSPTVFRYECCTGWDMDPSVTPDGKTIYYAARRQVFEYGEGDNIWMSRLLVDENGKIVTNIRENKDKPQNFEVYQNYPNPFNSETNIKYELLDKNCVSLIIYDAIGREVKRLVENVQEAGVYTIRWDARNRNGLKVTSGVYFYCLQAGNNYKVKKMIQIR
jgi:hypothetical protein